MVRLRGRCPRGERLLGYAPQGHWKTITFIAGLRHDAMVAPLVVDGAMTGEIFLAYIEQCLAPTLKRGDIVVMDKLPVHRVPGVAEAIAAAGAMPLYLSSFLFAGSQPNRAGLQQTQSASPQGGRTDCSAPVAQDRPGPGHFQRTRMYKFLPACRLCSHPTGICSSRKVGTTFFAEFGSGADREGGQLGFFETHSFWQGDAESIKECGLGGIGLGDATQANLAVAGGRQHDVVRLNACEFFEHGAWRVSETGALLPHLKALPQHEGEKADKDYEPERVRRAGARSGARSVDPSGYGRPLRPG
jgi:hypothetical protein